MNWQMSEERKMKLAHCSYGEREEVYKKSGLHTRIHSQCLKHSGFSNGGLEFWSCNAIWGPQK